MSRSASGPLPAMHPVSSVAAQLKGSAALHPRNLTRAFVTHLHSDHTAGYSDLILTPPAVGRVEPLEVYGPPGTERMTHHLLLAYEEDLEQRGVGRSKSRRSGYNVEAHDVAPGPVYSDEVVRVSAFRAKHGRWKHAYGYRFDAGGRSIVVSGDTAPTEAMVTACDGCDVLVHEVYCQADLKRAPPAGRTYSAPTTLPPWSWPSWRSARSRSSWCCTTCCSPAAPAKTS